jgi:hypothetical protein
MAGFPFFSFRAITPMPGGGSHEKDGLSNSGGVPGVRGEEIFQNVEFQAANGEYQNIERRTPRVDVRSVGVLSVVREVLWS